MRSATFVVVVLLAVGSAFASDPHEIFGDCADWVISIPGITCTEVFPVPCDLTTCLRLEHIAASNEDGFFSTPDSWTPDACPGGLGQNGKDATVYQFKDGVEQAIMQATGRCEIVNGQMASRWTYSRITFNAVTGTLFVAASGQCECGDAICDIALACPTANGSRLLRFDGFTTLFETVQSYEPTTGSISFRVPTMPEGFQHADYFDTYYGDLATVGDWSEAQPLQCGYPASPPSVGDYLTVEDTLPTPGAGEGYWYVTAATFQGQTRYGRQSNGGVLTGRNPAALPGCISGKLE